MRTNTTIEDVARQAGVSRAAVSKVIRNAYGVSDDMRRRVETAIDILGYRPSVAARAMRGSSFTIGVEIPSLANNFFDSLLRGANATLDGTGYQIIIAPAGPDHDNGPKAIQALADRHVDGILAVSPAVPPPWLEKLGARVPLVMIGRHDESQHYDTVVDDDLLGIRLAVEHLLGLGHRRIAHVTITPEAENQLPQAPHALRTLGYLAAMASAGLQELTQVVHVAPTEEATYLATLALLDEPHPPTAIVAGHDELAMGALTAVAERGLKAAQCSVVGYDDTHIAAHPLVSLTSVNQCAPDMGSAAVKMLLERIDGRTAPVHRIFTPSLVARRSSAPIAG
ncbi:MAG TPA: LacI family DNA-binding transcriptional regulator [Arachnia sp.]|nr:LacI family DNA-binding transcriptional regulator [Arachnia sp.]